MSRKASATEGGVVAFLVRASDEDHDRITGWVRTMREARKQFGPLELIHGSDAEPVRRTRGPNKPKPDPGLDSHLDRMGLGEKSRAIAEGKARKPHTKTDGEGNAIGVA